MKNNTQMVLCIHQTATWIPAKCEINTATETSDIEQKVEAVMKTGTSKNVHLHFKLAQMSHIERVRTFHFCIFLLLLLFFQSSLDTILNACEHSSRWWWIMQKWHITAAPLQKKGKLCSSPKRVCAKMKNACWGCSCITDLISLAQPKNQFTMFSTFTNIRWGPEATQTLWTCCHGSLQRPHLWLKEFFFFFFCSAD